MVKYISTRGGGEPLSFEQVLLAGLAPDGGLYVPESWPSLDIKSLKGKSYIDIAEAVMFPFVEGCIPHDDFRVILEETYSADIFRGGMPAPLHHLRDNLYVMELFHGPTIAFKDVALQLLGRLFDYVLKKRGERVTIVGATSGDTGSAAIEGCRHSEMLDIFILFPDGRVSDVQRRQMTTVDAPHVHNIALEGTFDDCQSLVKAMFNDPAFRAAHNLSAVNSINWARIMAQIVYYAHAALQFDELVSFVVPTGNFGNIFAAYCAQKMGVPIKTLAIATNQNDILTRFFESGTMKIGGLNPTMSPSMDIQISSNFERYLFDTLGRDADVLKRLMAEFQQTGEMTLEFTSHDLKAFRTSEEQTLATIKAVHEEHNYILDPHTAVGMHAAQQLAAAESTLVLCLATAHPAKFPDAVQRAIGQRPDLPEHLSGLMSRTEHLTKLPNDLQAVQAFVRSHV